MGTTRSIVDIATEIGRDIDDGGLDDANLSGAGYTTLWNPVLIAFIQVPLDAELAAAEALERSTPPTAKRH